MHEQHELYEKARARVKQKKRLYFHLIIYVLGCFTFFILNKQLNYGKDYDWYIWATLAWSFLFILHVVNVFITNRFFGKEWERKQTEKLVALQEKKIEKIKKKIEKEATYIAESEAYNERLNKDKPTSSRMITIIAAAAENNELGKDNKLIWHLSDDLKRFKRLTSGHHIIMGRKTFESFPKALPNRTNVVITRDTNYTAENAVIVHSIEEALELAKDDNQPFIIGGGEIYKQSLQIADRIELTRVHHSFEADTFFPEIDPSIWKEVQRQDCFKDEKHNYDYSFITYEKRS